MNRRTRKRTRMRWQTSGLTARDGKLVVQTRTDRHILYERMSIRDEIGPINRADDEAFH